jgi:uncharacterized protein with HEPN domain
MARNIGLVPEEILAAIQGIEEAIAEKSFADFQREWLLRHGVQRGIEIISEASRHLPAELLARHPEIAWDQVKGIGSVLRHEYHRIADGIIWAVAVERLGSLKTAIEAMAASTTHPD